MDPSPGAYTHVHRSITRKRAAQTRESTSRGLHSRAQVEHAEKDGYTHVDPRPGAYTPVRQSEKGGDMHVDPRPGS